MNAKAKRSVTVSALGDPQRQRVFLDRLADVRQREAAGATWVLTSFEPQPAEDVVREVIEAGP
jgi:hypothetical protein